jgi:hypothetical protein
MENSDESAVDLLIEDEKEIAAMHNIVSDNTISMRRKSNRNI